MRFDKVQFRFDALRRYYSLNLDWDPMPCCYTPFRL